MNWTSTAPLSSLFAALTALVLALVPDLGAELSPLVDAAIIAASSYLLAVLTSSSSPVAKALFAKMSAAASEMYNAYEREGMVVSGTKDADDGLTVGDMTMAVFIDGQYRLGYNTGVIITDTELLLALERVKPNLGIMGYKFWIISGGVAKFAFEREDDQPDLQIYFVKDLAEVDELDYEWIVIADDGQHDGDLSLLEEEGAVYDDR